MKRRLRWFLPPVSDMACTVLPWLGMCFTQSTFRTINQVLSYLGWNFSALVLPFSSLLLSFPPPCGVGLWYSGKRWDWIVDGCRLSLGGTGVHRRLGKKWIDRRGRRRKKGIRRRRRRRRRGKRKGKKEEEKGGEEGEEGGGEEGGGKGGGGKGEGRGVDRKKRDGKSDDRRRLGRESGEEWFVDSWKSLDSSGHTQNTPVWVFYHIHLSATDCQTLGPIQFHSDNVIHNFTSLTSLGCLGCLMWAMVLVVLLCS